MKLTCPECDAPLKITDTNEATYPKLQRAEIDHYMVAHKALVKSLDDPDDRCGASYHVGRCTEDAEYYAPLNGDEFVPLCEKHAEPVEPDTVLDTEEFLDRGILAKYPLQSFGGIGEQMAWMDSEVREAKA